MVPPRFFFLSSYFYLPRSCMVSLFLWNRCARLNENVERNRRLRSPLTNYNSRGSGDRKGETTKGNRCRKEEGEDSLLSLKSWKQRRDENKTVRGIIRLKDSSTPPPSIS